MGVPTGGLSIRFQEHVQHGEYVTYRSLQQRTALANQNLTAQQGTLDLTRRLFDAGLAPEIDVQRAAAQVATTASTIPLLARAAGGAGDAPSRRVDRAAADDAPAGACRR